IGRGDAFGGGEDVGLHAPVIDSEPLTGASPSGHDFICDQQHVVFVADAAQLLVVAGRWDQHTVGADNRLGKNGGDVAFVLDHVFEVVRTGNTAVWIGMFQRTLVAVHFGREDDTGKLAARL